MIILDIFTDGGARGNPGPAACAFVVKDTSGKIIHKEGKFLGRMTNNEAEYQGVILALKWLIKNKEKLFTYSHSEFISGVKTGEGRRENRTKPTECFQENLRVVFFLDSKLIVNQLNGFFKIKNPRLRELIFKIKILEKESGQKIFYSLIPRQKNKEVDKLVNQTLNTMT